MNKLIGVALSFNIAAIVFFLYLNDANAMLYVNAFGCALFGYWLGDRR